jgi:YjbE family integral membrane protein
VDPELLAAILSIILIDLVLSGDNALVIGMAASRLHGPDRRKAIIFGAGGAVLLRVIFTGMVAVLLSVPFIQLGGGLLLIWIAIKLVRPEAEGHGEVKAASTFGEAVRTIVMADVVMSLDNILAVGATAHGDLRLLLFGLALSIPLVTFGSGLVAWVLDRWSWLIIVGGAVLAWTAGTMLLEDPLIHDRLAGTASGATLEWAVPAALAVAVILLGFFLRKRAGEPVTPTLEPEPQPEDSSAAAVSAASATDAASAPGSTGTTRVGPAP